MSVQCYLWKYLGLKNNLFWVPKLAKLCYWCGVWRSTSVRQVIGLAGVFLQRVVLGGEV